MIHDIGKLSKTVRFLPGISLYIRLIRDFRENGHFKSYFVIKYNILKHTWVKNTTLKQYSIVIFIYFPKKNAKLNIFEENEKKLKCISFTSRAITLSWRIFRPPFVFSESILIQTIILFLFGSENLFHLF